MSERMEWVLGIFLVVVIACVAHSAFVFEDCANYCYAGRGKWASVNWSPLSLSIECSCQEVSE